MSIAMESERQLTVPEGALVSVAWTEGEPGMPDALILRLSLDNEEAEYTLRVAPEVAAELIGFFQRGTHAWLDPRRTPPRWAEAAFMRT